MYHIIYTMAALQSYAVSLTTLCVQLHIWAANSMASMAKCVHPNTVVKIKNKNFSVLGWHGLY